MDGNYISDSVAERFASTSSATMACKKELRIFFFLLHGFLKILFFFLFQSCYKGYSLHDYKFKNTHKCTTQMLTSKPMYK
jgi:hypothetical protein